MIKRMHRIRTNLKTIVSSNLGRTIAIWSKPLAIHVNDYINVSYLSLTNKVYKIVIVALNGYSIGEAT